MKLKIAHLYPKLLNLYGDRGNIIALCKRLEWRGVEYELAEFNLNEQEKQLGDYHLLFIGGGQDSQQDLVAKDFICKKAELQDLTERGICILAICGGYQLLGHSYQTSDGKEIPGLGIIDIRTQAKARKLNQQERLIGNVSAELLIDGIHPQTIVGFENHSGKTYIDPNSKETKPLARIITGFGNNGEDGYEGALHKNIFGTYLHGSLLPKNPHLSDELILRSMKYAKHPYLNENKILTKLDDSIEYSAHTTALKL